MDKATKDNLSNRNIWARVLYMLLFVIAYSISETILVFVAIFQVLAVLFTGHVHATVHQFGANLSGYMYQILQFVTFNSEDLPFPFTDWPEHTVGETPYTEAANETAPIIENVDTQAPESAIPDVEHDAGTTTGTDSDSDSNLADNDEEDPSKPAV